MRQFAAAVAQVRDVHVHALEHRQPQVVEGRLVGVADVATGLQQFTPILRVLGRWETVAANGDKISALQVDSARSARTFG